MKNFTILKQGLFFARRYFVSSASNPINHHKIGVNNYIPTSRAYRYGYAHYSEEGKHTSSNSTRSDGGGSENQNSSSSFKKFSYFFAGSVFVGASNFILHHAKDGAGRFISDKAYDFFSYVDLESMATSIQRSRYGIIILRPLQDRSKAEQGTSYENAKCEIVLLPSAGGHALHRSHERYQGRTVDNIWNILETQAEKGVSIKILMVDPRKIKGDPRLAGHEKNIIEEAITTIEQVIEFNMRIKNENIRSAKPMQVKLLDHLPSFSADLIDTDIEKSTEHYKKVETSQVSIIQKTFGARTDLSYVCTFEDVGEYVPNTSKKHPSPNGKVKAPFFHYREIMYEEWKSDRNITVTQENWNIIKNDALQDKTQSPDQTMVSSTPKCGR